MTGTAASAFGVPAAGGEIGKTREELARVRTHGVKRIGLMIGGILLAAVLLPRLLLWVLRRLMGGKSGDDSSLVLSALLAVLKVLVWVAAVATFFARLQKDRADLQATFGIKDFQITELVPALSDHHHHGQSGRRAGADRPGCALPAAAHR